MPGFRGFVLLLLVAGLALLMPAASAGWAFTRAYTLPPAPDHEHSTTFYVSLVYRNDTVEFNNTTGGNGTGTNGTGTNGTGTNGTGTNGTGTNGTGTNGTGNETQSNVTVNITGVNLVIYPAQNASGTGATRYNMSRIEDTNDFTFTLGPWAPGQVLRYYYEASLSNGSFIRSNESSVRTPDIVSILWHDSLPEAKKLASELGRPLMIFVYSDFDHSTRQMDEEVFNRTSVLRLSADFVCVRLNRDVAPEKSRELNVTKTPSLVFLNATSGKEQDRLSGPVDAAGVADEMRYILGEGPRPRLSGPSGPGYRLETIVLGASLIAGPAVMYALIRTRLKKR